MSIVFFSPPSLSLTALPFSVFCLSLCQLWRSPYLLILAWETSILGSQSLRNNIFLDTIPLLQSPPYGTLVTSIFLLSSSPPLHPPSPPSASRLSEPVFCYHYLMPHPGRWTGEKAFSQGGNSYVHMVMIWWGGQARLLLEGLWLALCWPCWAPSTSKKAGVLNQGDPPPSPPCCTHTHTCPP